MTEKDTTIMDLIRERNEFVARGMEAEALEVEKKLEALKSTVVFDLIEKRG